MGFLGGAALLTAAVAVSKLLGALYKIPLGNLLGSRGMGCFQAAYNVYGVLLTLSTAGLPLAMSRLIAQSRGRPRRQRRIFHVALALFLALGLVGSGVMLTLPRQLAGLLHNELAAPSIRVLAPALLAVCLLSAIRGYTQGQGQMLPTAVSQVVESAGKLVVGLGLTGASPRRSGPPGPWQVLPQAHCWRCWFWPCGGCPPAWAATHLPPGGRCWVSC